MQNLLQWADLRWSAWPVSSAVYEVTSEKFNFPLSFDHTIAWHRPKLAVTRDGPTLLWAVAWCPLLTFNILQFYNFHFRISSFTPHIKRYVGVLKWCMASLMVSLVGWKARSPRAVAVQGRVDSNSDWGWGSHSSDRLAVGCSRGARGPERRAPNAVRASLVAQAIPAAAGSWGPFTRNFKSVPARAVRRWSPPFPCFPFGLPALMPWLLRAGLWIRPQLRARLMPGFRLNHLRETRTVTPLTRQSKQIPR